MPSEFNMNHLDCQPVCKTTVSSKVSFLVIYAYHSNSWSIYTILPPLHLLEFVGPFIELATKKLISFWIGTQLQMMCQKTSLLQIQGVAASYTYFCV